tara:strand:- start:680 stop:1636 length:957 start_codon:yes stop_codon:yes gene_type:complete
MINLTLVSNRNTSPSGETNVGLLQEYASHYNSYLEELTPYHRDVYQIISETTMRSYFFPYNACPWHSDYYGSIDFLDMSGKRVGIDEVRKHVSSSQRRERTTWLMDYAFNQTVGRAQDVTVGICTPWANVITPILYSTYKAMAMKHPKHLVSYRDLVTPVPEGGLGVVGQAKTKTVRNKWSEQVFRTKLEANVVSDTNPNAPIREILSKDMPEFSGELDNQRRFFYTRVNARAAFCHKAVMWKAHSIAFDKMHGRDHWNEKLKYWEEGLGHSREIIDFIFDYHTKNNTDSLQWLLNLHSDDALMPLSHYCDFDENKWR